MKEFFWKYDAEIKATLIVFNLVLATYLFILYRMALPVIERQEGRSVASPQTIVSDECGEECQRIIDERVAQATATLSAFPSEPRQFVPAAPAATVPITTFLPLGGGSTIERDWTTVGGSEFVFDLKDYPSDAKVYWEGNLKVRHENNKCYARVFDKSNSRAVDFSEQSTSKTSFENLTSQLLTIWAGKNNYRLEFKSLVGSDCFLEAPRIIIKY